MTQQTPEQIEIERLRGLLDYATDTDAYRRLRALNEDMRYELAASKAKHKTDMRAAGVNVAAAVKLRDQARNTGMNWVKAEGFKPERGKWYVVLTNGAQWRDQHIFVWYHLRLEHYLRPEIVRDKPLWVAEVTDPTKE